MPKKPLPTEQRVILPNISWPQFEKLLAELGPERQARMTYLRGKLEMMTPVEAHERCSKLIDSLILVLVDELAMPITSVVPVMLKQVEMGCAAESDACYYFQEIALRHTTQIDLAQDPVPDLLVEVALTRSNLEKLPIYATLGIPEVWRYITTAGDDMLKGQLLMYELQQGDYVQQRQSTIFPFLPADRVLEFMEQSDSMSLSAALRLLRAWVADKQGT
jgi:Uma2 family endonuclease